MTPIVYNIGTKKMKERTKALNLIVYQFSLMFVNILLTSRLYFHVWLQNKVKILLSH